MNTQTKHTPGPWRVARQNPSPTTGEWMIAGGKPGYLAEIRDCGSGDVTANARLVAAAPELLAALQQCADYLDCIPEAAAGGCDDARELVRIARNAISKATEGAA
jgi:hypothetical protein